MAQTVPYDKVTGTRIGFLADTHVRMDDASDLPDAVLKAFEAVDLIVHLGDMGQVGILDLLATVAPVLATRNTRTDPQDGGTRIAEHNRIIEINGVRIGATFELVNGLANKPRPGCLPEFYGSVESLAIRLFGEQVDVIAFGGTHMEVLQEREGVMLFNPGSPTLPASKAQGGQGTVAVLDVSSGVPAVNLVRLPRAEDQGIEVRG